MRRFRTMEINAEVQRELAVVDAALRGVPVAAEHAPLAELACELRALRPRPEQRFIHELDTSAATGFGRQSIHERATGATGVHRTGGSARGGRRGAWLTHAAFAAVAVIVVAAAVALPLTLSGGHNQRSRHAASSVAERSEPQIASQMSARTRTAGPARSSESSAAATGVRQIERSATLDVGVTASSVESKSHEVFSIVSAFNGYVRQSNVSSGGPGQGGASFDVRIPSSNLAAAIAALSRLGHVRSENDATNDVSERVGSLQAALEDARAERASLRRQLASTSDPQVAERLRAQLRSIAERLSRLGTTLGALRKRVAYSALALTLTAEAGGTSGAKKGELTPAGAARAAERILEAALAVLVLVAATLLPLGVIALGAWLLGSGTRRRLRQQALNAS